MTLDSTHEFAPAGFDINKAGTRLPKIAILDRWTRIPRAKPLLAISGMVDTCSISTGEGWIWRNRDEPEILWESVAFLKEWVGFFRIPGSGSYRITS